MSDDFERRYVAEMVAAAEERIAFSIPLATLGNVVGTIQLALRHPEFPLSLRADIESFLAHTIAKVAERHPTIAEGLERGSDPSWDQPRRPGR